MALSKEPLNPTYDKRVKHQMKRYANLNRKRFSLRSELDTLKSYKKGLLLQIGDINVSIDALDRMIRARKVAAQGRAS
jgi:predicted ATP-grasp superfamily ATP-dependent carboligase